MKTKALKITLTVVVSIVLALILVLALVKIGERILFTQFYAKSTTEFKTPAIADGFVHQGFEYCEEKEIFLASGYMKDGSSSRVYKLSKDGEELGYTKLRNQTGGRNTTHAGGITYYGDYVYIADDGDEYDGLLVYSLDDILNEEEARCLGVIKVGLSPSCCFVEDGKLYTANFHKDDSAYLSPEEFKITTPAQNNNTAMIAVFDLDAQNKANFGFDDYKPEYAISITSQVQGMVLADDKLVLSTSWGVSKSHLYIYDYEKIMTSSQDKTTAFGEEIPLYYADSSNLEKDVKAPPMAEELVYLDGKIFIMNESASAKYIFGKFTSGNYIHSYKI